MSNEANIIDGYTHEQIDAAMRAGRVERSEAFHAGLKAVATFFRNAFASHEARDIPATGRAALS